MLRRSFLRLLAAIPALPFVGRAKAEPQYEYRVVPLTGSKPLTDTEAMEEAVLYATSGHSCVRYMPRDCLLIGRNSVVSWIGHDGRRHMKYLDHKDD